MTHTQGPLHAGHIGDGQYRREVVFDRNSGQVAEITMPGGVADATLYAAAPDLLQACKQIELIYAEYWALCPPAGRAMDMIMDAVRNARAAIAKAEGRAR